MTAPAISDRTTAALLFAINQQENENMASRPPDGNALNHSRTWRTTRGFLAVLATVVIGGVLYQDLFLALDRRASPMPGKRVDVGGFKMHIYCTGHGAPAVILDSGLGDSYMAWQRVQPKIAKFIQVCSYDRGGMGYSDPSSHPRTSRAFAEELHQLLRSAGVPSPYILVGHSMAGFNVRIYAALYASEVAGKRSHFGARQRIAVLLAIAWLSF
jgi:hypothetical protein